MKRKRKLLKFAVALLASVASGYFVLASLSFGDLTALAQRLDIGLLVLAFCVYLTANVVRALRFRLLVENGVPATAFLRIIFIQNFLNTFLPLRAGEVSYLYMVHRMGNVSPGQNLGSLLGARALDFLAALFIPLALSPLSRGWSASGHPVAWISAFGLTVALGLATGIRHADRIADYLNERLTSKRPTIQRAVGLLVETLRALGQLLKRRLLTRVVLLSLFCWILIYASGYVLLVSAGLVLPLPDAMFAYGFPVLASMTPFYMLGGFGVYEGSVGVGLTMIGVPTGTALATGVLLHAAELSFIIVSALFAPFIGRRAAGSAA